MSYKTVAFLLVWIVEVETSTNERGLTMRGLIFLGLLVCVHGLADRFPFGNHQDQNYGWQTAGEWVKGICLSGTKQSPIDVISREAISMSQPDFMLNGYNYDTVVDWQIDGTSGATKPLTTVNFSPVSGHKPQLSGGPLHKDER